jgi:hypothetical protein
MEILQMHRKYRLAATVVTAVFVIGLIPEMIWASASYEGKWVRTSKYVDGVLSTTQPAVLVLTLSSFTYIGSAPPEDACGFSGTMRVLGGHMKVSVQVSSCPTKVAVGVLLDYAYTVTEAGLGLTTSIATAEGVVKEVWKKDTEGLLPSGACTHPLCGTWNRVATYVNGELMHTVPAYTVFTQATYYSVTATCYNTLSLDSVGADTFTMTMKSHNCPGPPGYMGPGTVVMQSYELRDEGQTLIVINTQYGGAVKTVFKRLE